MREPDILLWDIETSLMTMYSFRLYDSYHTPDDIIDDWTILCAAWKWYGKKPVYALAGDEKKIVSKLIEQVTKADIIVYHNGDKFDLKRLKTRAIFHGLKPPPNFNTANTVDTLKAAKKEFNFTSNKLDYIAQYLDVGKKIKVDKGLWRRVAEGDKKAIKEMLEYNKEDVRVLERVYEKMRPYISNHPNVNVFADTVSYICSGCSGINLIRQGYKFTRAGKYQKWQCKDCGKWMQESKAIKRFKVK